jgi:hypothetical protein
VDERREVLLGHRASNREDYRLGGIVEEPIDQRIDASIGATVRELLEIATRREHADPARIIRIVIGILDFGLVARRRDDRGRPGDGFLFDRDPTVETRGFRAITIERSQFHPAERMRGEDIGDAGASRHARRDQSGIGIVRVHDVGRAIERGDVSDQSLDQAVMLGPQVFLDEIRIGRGQQADDTRRAVDRLDRLGITFRIGRMMECTGNDFHPVDRRIAAAGSDEIEKVPDMAPGIRGDSVFDVGCA